MMEHLSECQSHRSIRLDLAGLVLEGDIVTFEIQWNATPNRTCLRQSARVNEKNWTNIAKAMHARGSMDALNLVVGIDGLTEDARNELARRSAGFYNKIPNP